MTSLFEITISIFVVSTAISIIIIMRQIGSLKKAGRYSQRSQLMIIENRLNSITVELEKIKQQISGLEIKLKTEEGTEKRKITKTREIKTSTETKKAKYPSSEEYLSSIEIETLKIIGEEGEVTSSQLTKILNRSREHISRTLKSLYEKGYLERIETQRPFRYKLSQKAMEALEKVIG